MKILIFAMQIITQNLSNFLKIWIFAIEINTHNLGNFQKFEIFRFCVSIEQLSFAGLSILLEFNKTQFIIY